MYLKVVINKRVPLSMDVGHIGRTTYISMLLFFLFILFLFAAYFATNRFKDPRYSFFEDCHQFRD